MLEKLRRGFEHLQAKDVVNDAFKNGVTDAFHDLENHPHPAVREHFFDNLFKLVKRHPLFTTTLVAGSIGTAIAIKAHEKSQKRADEIFEDILSDPLKPRDYSASDSKHPEPKLNLKRVRQTGKTAIEKGRGEDFITNLCESTVRHPNEGVEFWTNLDPQSEIFTELVDPETRDIRHRNQKLEIVTPRFQPKYETMLNRMTEELDRLAPKLDKDGKLKLDKDGNPLSYRTDIYNKLRKR